MASSMCSRLVKHYHYYHYHRTTNSGYYGPLHPRLGGQPSSHEGSLSHSGFSSISQLSLHTLVLPVLPHEHHNVQYLHMELFKVDSSASSYGHRVATRAVDLYEAEYGPTLGFRCFGE